MAVNYNKMTMAQLKAELSKRNLQVSGKKSELVTRLDEHDKLMREKEEATKKAELEEKEDGTAKEGEDIKKEEEDDIKTESEATTEQNKVEVKTELQEENEKPQDDTEEMDQQSEETKADEKMEADKEASEVKEEEDKGTEEKIGDKDAIDIISQIDDIISDDTTNKEANENKDDEMKEAAEENVDNNLDDSKDETKEENKESTEKDEKEEGKDDETTKSEDKPEEPKVQLKTDDFDFTKSATGFVIALDNGKNIVIPVKDMLKIDMKSRRQSKTVLAYPLSIADLTSGKLNPFIEKCCHFNISFNEYSHEKQKSTKGYAEFIFATDEEAHEQADIMAEVNDNLVVRQLSRKDKPNNTYNDIPQEQITVNNMLKKYIYIGNLPSTATEEELQALFPESNNLAVIVNNDGLPKGYALAELPSSEAVDEAIKKSMKINYPGYENKLLIMRPWAKIPKGILDSSTRKDLLDKIRNLRKLRMKCTDDIVRNRLENDMALMKMKLDKDCKARDEVGLPVPPDIVRLEEAKAAKRESDKSKDKAGSNISTIQRGNKSVRRGGVGGGTVTTAGTFGNNQGFKKPYQNQGGRGGFSGRQNYRGGSQNFRGGNQGFRSPSNNQGFRQGNNQGFRAGNQSFQGNSQNYQTGFQPMKQGFGSNNLGMKQGFGSGGYDSGKDGFGQGYGGQYDSGKQGYNLGGGSGYDSMKPGYVGNQEPGVNNAVEMLMHVSKMLGTNPKAGGSSYGNQGYNASNQNSNYSQNNFSNQGNFGSQSSNFGGSFSSRGGGFSGGYKRRADDVGYGGGGKRNTGYYNQKRW